MKLDYRTRLSPLEWPNESIGQTGPSSSAETAACPRPSEQRPRKRLTAAHVTSKKQMLLMPRLSRRWWTAACRNTAESISSSIMWADRSQGARQTYPRKYGISRLM
ncbi:hypothetical protein GB937_008945 [Aspergillus fischeri]|nr:hypothetical protein GB937_008945 [Aspergillus fischeri]